MSNGNRAFRVAATSARVIMGVAVIAACVVGVATAIHAPWPTVAHFPRAGRGHTRARRQRAGLQRRSPCSRS
ncbi:hypothetical protein LJR042_002229 [Microbacterium maritypicum]|uniref:hypothetical protein n=1 Tax=Microbacterium maritypicum TaxID=33918 RepID=UPI003ECFE04D